MIPVLSQSASRRRAVISGGGGGLGYVATVLADSPWLYYRLGESSGTTAVDASGNGRDGTVGAIWGSAGAIAGDADTATNNLSISRTLLFQSSDATFEAWFRVETGVGGMSCNDGTGSHDKDFGPTFDGNVHFLWSVVGGALSPQLASPNITFGTGSAPYYHVVGTVNSSISCLYVNGVLVDSAAASGSFTGYVGPNFIASFSGGCYVDELAIYTTALSAARVLAHYNAGIGI